ncbi:MAG: uroporphyrinogen decarboxylase family protein [Armatimonadota bacterium]|jgi:uroporphyrinogen decarboxylase
MTTRERFLKCMSFEPVDRPPNFEMGAWGQTRERWIGEGMPAEIADEITFHGMPFFGVERRGFCQVNYGMKPPFEQEVLEEDDRHIVLRDAGGIVRRALKEGTVRGTRPSMDQYLSFPVTDRESFEKMKRRYDGRDPERYRADWPEAVEGYRARDYPLCVVPNACLGLYSTPRRWMGTEATCTMFHDDPKLMHEMLDFIADFIIESSARALQDVEPDYFNWFEDFAFKTGPLVSPRIFREFLLPRYRRVNDHLRATGIEIILLDSDGNIDVLIPLLLEAGINGIWPMEIAADTDPIKLRREYGHDLTLSGGIDKRELARDKKAIEDEVMATIPPLLEDGGYIPTIDHSVPPDVSYENWLYYLEVKMNAMEG